MPLRVLNAAIVYNEGDKFAAFLDRLLSTLNHEWSYLIVDDGSTDGSIVNHLSRITAAGISVIRHHTNLGVGASIRTAIGYAKQNAYDIISIMAGSGRMDPAELPRLLQPVIAGTADYVQGSRYLPGGRSINVPLYRYLGIKVLTQVSRIVTGFPCTDITCGFRCYRLDILDRAGIDLANEKLNGYELEYYLHYKVAKARLILVEVPVTMRYPIGDKHYSKVAPFTGWWAMLKPFLYLTARVWK
ncbi:MAG: glycosyltransferase family 2 protein [Thermaerobacter sp.]|nr:glycosyltransferase family 2 protein [Thermaerobacter sp.]